MYTVIVGPINVNVVCCWPGLMLVGRGRHYFVWCLYASDLYWWISFHTALAVARAEYVYLHIIDTCAALVHTSLPWHFAPGSRGLCWLCSMCVCALCRCVGNVMCGNFPCGHCIPGLSITKSDVYRARFAMCPMCPMVPSAFQLHQTEALPHHLFTISIPPFGHLVW